MKKSVIKNDRIAFASLILFLGIVLTISFVLAAHVITTSSGGTSYSVNEDVGFVYNITVNNTDSLNTANITQVNITFPNTFSFLADSNGTDAGVHTFTNTSTILSWDNDGLVMNLTWKYFWFNLTATNPGNYNLSVATTNATGTETTNISVTINDTTEPSSIEFVSPSETDNSNLSRSNIAVNVTATDNGVIDTIIARLFNSTNDQINSSTSATSPLFINFTGLSDGVYYFNATVNDTYGNSNSTSTRTITLDTTYPLIDYGTGTESDNANVSQSNVYVNVSVTETNEKNITFLLYNSTGQVNSTTYTDGTRTINWTSLPDGAYTYNTTIIDDAGNSNTTSTRTITLDSSNPIITLIAPADSTSSTTSAYNFTFNVSDDQTISNCSLIFDGSIINTLINVNNSGGTNGMYNSSLSVATHTWSINCTDIAGNVGNSSTRTLIVSTVATTTTSSSSGGGGYPNYRPKEDELNKGYQKLMYKNWKVSFKVENISHTFKVEDVTETNAKISISSETQEATLSVGQEKKFELSGDNYYDVLVKLNSIDTTWRNKANFTIQTIHEEIVSQQQESEAGEETTQKSPESEAGEEKGDLTWLWVLIAVIMILILSGIGYKKLKNR
ncbi:MAG: hypothetical protein ABIJ20_02590 [Nanoarchaeota archaeon]|nr:hypothetical protein [Nanoarchaeota archaeon]MBU1445079.1 hypothetical protein [Nanoarchaeota archaeon]MBU2420733.1 hypothetical protein [Nanoarchaeota archaeon]MBU2475206.1 hypothetical protein [Nanoarchaeota archaeon]